MAEPKPLGVGITLQPNTVRELIDLWLEAQLDKIGVRTRHYGLYTKSGHKIWGEPRGHAAGNFWPQFSLRRGKLQMLLLKELQRRAGADAVVTDAGVAGFKTTDQGATLVLTTATTSRAASPSQPMASIPRSAARWSRTRANRGKGPDAVMQMVEERCGGVFDDIETTIPHADLADHDKRLSGFLIATLNALPPIIGPMEPMPA